MRLVLRTLAVGCLVALIGFNGHAQQPEQKSSPATPADPNAQGQTPVFRTGINFVRVDVIVTDRNGKEVSDLKQTDFEVLEDGKPQMVDAFKLVKLDGGAMPTSEGPPRAIRTDDDEQQEAARDDVRLFAVFLDDYHV